MKENLAGLFLLFAGVDVDSKTISSYKELKLQENKDIDLIE